MTKGEWPVLPRGPAKGLVTPRPGLGTFVRQGVGSASPEIRDRLYAELRARAGDWTVGAGIRYRRRWALVTQRFQVGGTLLGYLALLPAAIGAFWGAPRTTAHDAPQQ